MNPFQRGKLFLQESKIWKFTWNLLEYLKGFPNTADYGMNSKEEEDIFQHWYSMQDGSFVCNVLCTTGCSISKVPKVRHCKTHKKTFLCLSYVQNILRHGPWSILYRVSQNKIGFRKIAKSLLKWPFKRV